MEGAAQAGQWAGRRLPCFELPLDTARSLPDFGCMLTLEQAQRELLAVLRPLPAETVLVQNARGRVLAEPVVAPGDLPPFDQAAMDGYAMRAADLAGATEKAPVALTLRGRVPAGGLFEGRLEPGQCVRVFTGAPLPEGADAVVMQEDCRWVAERPDQVLFLKSAAPGEHVRRRGEDVRQGLPVLPRGHRLGLGAVALLAGLGLRELRVAQRPRLGVLATGSELIEPGQPLQPGKVHECNRALLAALLDEAGAVPRVLPLVPDTLEATRSALEAALADCDAVVSSGGVSVGELDLVRAAFEQLGGKLAFWKVAIRPGKPFLFGRLGEKCLFGLPGNPASALVSCLLLVRPAVLRMQGAADLAPPSHPGVLAEPMRNHGDRPHFARVRLDDAGRVWSAGLQASHALSSLAKADGLVEVPVGAAWPAGTPVRVLRWDVASGGGCWPAG